MGKTTGGRPFAYTDEHGDHPQAPSSGWKSGSLKSAHGRQLIALFVDGKIALVSLISFVSLFMEAMGALTYHYGDHGVPPHRCPFFMTALLDTHYKNGSYFPKGGSRSIAKCLTAAIERRGGHVYALSPVQKILTKTTLFGTKAIGVRVRGVDILANKVVSDAGILKTFGVDSAGEEQTPLVDFKMGKSQRALLRNKNGYPTFDAVSPSLSDLSLFIGLDRTDKELHLPPQNIWHLRDWDHESSWKDAMKTTSALLDNTADLSTPFLFISNESAKDPDFACRHPGNKSTVEIIGMVKYDLFKTWENTSHTLRHADYIEVKRKIVESYLEVFYLHFPQCRGHVVFTSLGTPLTMNKFLGRKFGEVYSLDHDIARFDGYKVQRALHPQTTIQNLYLTGEDAFVVSVTASMISGYVTAARVSWWSFWNIVPMMAWGLPRTVFG